MGAESTFEEVQLADALRRPERSTEPDPRCLSSAAIDQAGVRQWTLNDQYEAIRKVELNASVPHSVRIHFETAKNVYLYSWFVYRFFPIAEQHALTSLEFALRERLAMVDRQVLSGIKAPGPKGLAKYLHQACALKLIRNEGLQIREQSALQRARHRYEMEMLWQMMDSGLDEIEFDDSAFQVLDEDYDIDWIGLFAVNLPVTRNAYAHGSKTLHPSVIQTFEIVGELINQIFPMPSES